MISIITYLSLPIYHYLSIITYLSLPIYHYLSIITYLSILSYPILSYPILSYPILSYPILSYPIYLSIYLIFYCRTIFSRSIKAIKFKYMFFLCLISIHIPMTSQVTSSLLSHLGVDMSPSELLSGIRSEKSGSHGGKMMGTCGEKDEQIMNGGLSRSKFTI